MIKSITIDNNENLPLKYSYKLESLKNGTKFDFIKGVNIIIGKNGSGKSTLLKNISYYLLCSSSYYSKLPNFSMFGEALKMDDLFNDTQLRDGMKINCDYAGVVYNYIPYTTQGMEFDAFACANRIECSDKSVGEKTRFELCSLFDFAFSNKDIQFPIKELIHSRNNTNDYWKERFTNLLKYYKSNSFISNPDEFAFTFLIDEPDKNLDISNIGELYDALSYQKEMTQLICVIHNPILIYKLSKLKHINIIELTDGYLEEIKDVFSKL